MSVVDFLSCRPAAVAENLYLKPENGPPFSEASIQARLLSSNEVEDAVALFERIAGEEGWTPNGGLRADVEQSVYFGLTTGRLTQRLIGGLQLLHPSADGAIPSHHVWPELPHVNPAASLYVAMLAVEKEWRGAVGGVFWPLATAMWRYAVLHHVTDLWLEATPRTLRCYQRMGWPLEIQGDLRLHWGEYCYVTKMTVRDVGGALAERAVRSQQYRNIVPNALCPDGLK